MNAKLRSLLVLFLALGVLTTLAQEDGKRIIEIVYSGGSQRAENLRYGPLVYSHPEPEGIIATVSNLRIFSQQAELSAPPQVLIANAKGQREATFEGGVRVRRGRLTAVGPSLVYSESTGLGVMPERADIRVEPAQEGDGVVEIAADTVTFDVDTDVSISRGGVTIVNDNQSGAADEVIFEEQRNLAKLANEQGQPSLRRLEEDGDELLINAEDIRLLTDEKKLLATGRVTIVDGDIRTTGDTVYFDDEASRAEVLGNPAVSVNEAEGTTVSGARLEQRTDLDIVIILDDSVPAEFEPAEFELSAEILSD